MKQRSSKTKNTVMIVVIVLLSLIIVCGGAFAYLTFSKMNKEAMEIQNALQAKINSSSRSGYVTITDIKMGEVVTEGMLQRSDTIMSEVAQECFITSNDIGKVATINIPSGIPVLTNMVSVELAEAYRERECSFIWLSTNLEANDYVDVRILFPNGEDYIVAAKKCIKNPIIAANNVYLWLTEEEILSLDAAVVDANLHGAKIYTTKYVKPEIQEASVVNYEPNADVMRVMQDDPNIVKASARALSIEARSAMEHRITLFEEAYPDFILDEYYERDHAVTNSESSENSSSSPNNNSGTNEPSNNTSSVNSDSKANANDVKNDNNASSVNDSEDEEEVKYVK